MSGNFMDEAGRAIADIESKKRAITQASTNEQNIIKDKINNEYKRVGETTYTLYKENKFEIGKITADLDTISELHQNLEEKVTKLKEIIDRYDEELSILRPPPPPGSENCPGCGEYYMPGEMMFCRKCGNKLPQKALCSSAVAALSSAQCPMESQS